MRKFFPSLLMLMALMSFSLASCDDDVEPSQDPDVMLGLTYRLDLGVGFSYLEMTPKRYFPDSDTYPRDVVGRFKHVDENGESIEGDTAAFLFKLISDTEAQFVRGGLSWSECEDEVSTVTITVDEIAFTHPNCPLNIWREQ